MNKSILTYVLLALGTTSATQAANYTATEGKWKLEIPESTKKLAISYDGIKLFNSAYAKVTYNYVGESNDKTISSLEPAAMPRVSVETVSDCFGDGKTYELAYAADGAVMKQRLSFYPSLPYMIAQVTVESVDGRELQSRSLTALAIGEASTPLKGASNRIVWVPFDNDGHLKYEIFQMKNNDEMPSHEVGYVFDGESRRGLIAGSVDHDTWKSAVTIAGTNGYRLEKFECLSGYTDYFSRDELPHGKVKGTTVASARFFVGLYEDWRQGLNDFGDANTRVVPKAEWTGGNPIGWSSWGVQQNYINFDGVIESAGYIKEKLYDLGFHDNNGRTVISLDAFATDNISQAQLYNMGMKLFKDGTYREGRVTKEGSNQILGQYCGPLVAWEWALDSKVPGTGLGGSRDYTYRDIALRVNGNVLKVNSNGGCAVDPTHPGVKANIEYFMKQYASTGTKYIKVDFLNNGIIEGDSWYDPNVTTGVQAYNYGMKLLYDEAAKYGMYIVESISPIFPYQYAHGRRTCCDRFSEIGESEYVMNAMSYGWWTDRLYTVNDPDQLVMCKGGHGARETMGENRARATSGMATGAFIFGDNFSDKVVYTDDNDGHTRGNVVGYPEESRTRALTIMGNADINDYVRNNTGSFMPVEGHKPSSSQSAESQFMRRVGNHLYVAVFNWNRIFTSSGEINYSRIGITDNDEITEVKELWSGETMEPSADKVLNYSVPAKDVKVYRFTFGDDGSGIDETVADKADEVIVAANGAKHFTAVSAGVITRINVFDITGKSVSVVDPDGSTEAAIDLSSVAAGIYIVDVVTADGRHHVSKVINK